MLSIHTRSMSRSCRITTNQCRCTANTEADERRPVTQGTESRSLVDSLCCSCRRRWPPAEHIVSVCVSGRLMRNSNTPRRPISETPPYPPRPAARTAPSALLLLHSGDQRKSSPCCCQLACAGSCLQRHDEHAVAQRDHEHQGMELPILKT